MQAYHNGGQAYYPQPQYQPQPGPYITHYTAGYPQFQPPVVPAQGYQQFPSTYPPEQYEPPPQTHQFPSLPRPKNLKRGHTLATPNPKAVPLKPALKRPQHDRSGSMGTVPAPAQLSRASSRATSEQRQRVNSTTRPRADSNALFVAGAFSPQGCLALSGLNELSINRSHLPRISWLE
ncbi:hypothetical protein PHLCEN_2v465 [Hermanssonia centrifuga]|uniref:Uncharacterized protein n=1 Tax=Hermanssonia centrifuga TaxID=98765 RepID=A0A2R6S5S7_9APHY|nr:hypothetical protein PHLCEN_2v465 [Hermanssonia centrifuga]